MGTLIDLSEYFIYSLGSIGDFLLSTPLSGIENIGWLFKLFPGWSSLTVAELVLGAGLVVLLSYKLIKFFVDLFS